MDIFNRKKVEELERKLFDIELENKSLIEHNAHLATTIETITEYVDATPTDCVRGEWCSACEFGKKFLYKEIYGAGHYQWTTKYICGKGKSCPTFIPKED